MTASRSDGVTYVHSCNHSGCGIPVTHAALLIAQNEHPKVIQTRLGHSSIRTTLDTYGHLFDGLDDGVADRLEEAGAPSSRPQRAPSVTRLES